MSEPISKDYKEALSVGQNSSSSDTEKDTENRKTSTYSISNLLLVKKESSPSSSSSEDDTASTDEDQRSPSAETPASFIFPPSESATSPASIMANLINNPAMDPQLQAYFLLFSQLNPAAAAVNRAAQENGQLGFERRGFRYPTV